MNPKWFIIALIVLEVGAAVSFAMRSQWKDVLFWAALSLANVATALR